MQNVTPLLLALLTCCLLSCETSKPAPTTSVIEKTSICGEILVGVTTEQRKLEVAGATLRDFSFGKVQTRVTPEFQGIASEAAMNGELRVKIACKAMELSGGKPSDERFSYYMQLLGFLSSDPSPSAVERTEWAKQVPFPKAPQLRTPNPPDTGTVDSVQPQ